MKIEKQLKRQEVYIEADDKSVVFRSTMLDDPFEFEYEWDDIYYLARKEYETK